MAENRKITLASRPGDRPSEDNFRLVAEPCQDPPEGCLLIEVACISIDAFIRTTMEEDAFHGTVPIGGTIPALGVGRVVASTAAGFGAGDWVSGPTLAQTHATMPASMFQKIEVGELPPSVHLGILGMTTGLTAYFGLLEVAGVSPEDTVVISGAAGAVGSVACQLARIRGGRVIGIAGGPEKTRYLLEELGASAAIDYKGEDVAARLRELAPNGVNVFFDNVGGELLDTVLDQLASGARIAICGAISQYDNRGDVHGPRLYLRLAQRNACMCGFTVDRFQERFGAARTELSGWMQDEGLALREHVERGIERFPSALLTLFSGGHIGKMLVKP